ncbi:hypothetical protein AAG906_018587 [Vitis piasezkii]
MKQHLPRVKGDIGPCKSVPPNIIFRMENSLQEFVNSKKATQEAYEYRNPYGPNMSQFERDMVEGEEEVQEMQCPMAATGKEAIWRADMAVGRFFYDACTPTNVVNSFYFKSMLDAISAIGLGYNRQRTLINFLVHCPKGISFVKSVDASDIVKNAANLFLLFDEVIEWVAHCLNLVFKDSGKMDHVAELILQPGATRFATTFIALKSLHDHKHDLQALVTSKFFVDSRYSKDNKSKVAVFIILDNRFWNDCLIVMNLMSPLMRLLHIVDCDERSLMEYVYEGMYRFYNKKRIYDPIDYACIDETDFWIVDENQPTELDVEELKNLLYEEGSIPINEVESSSSHIDDEDGGGVVIEGLDVENFGFPDADFQSLYSNFQNK